MQSGSRKITRKELKEDKLITAYYKTVSFLNKHSKNTAIALGVLIAGIVIVILVINSKKQANLLAGYDTFLAQLSYEQGYYREAADILLQTQDKYSGTHNAGEAALLMGKTYFSMGEFDSAAYYAELYINKYHKNSVSTVSAIMLQAAAKEELKDYLTAAELYMKASSKYSDIYTTPINLLDAGRCYNLAGENERAVEAYNSVLERYSDSNVIRRAQEQLARVKAEKRG
ncbi:tetratricopeptide repeat protein [bacterium]|nr:tetratricopeptide repeat protein [bacterium]